MTLDYIALTAARRYCPQGWRPAQDAPSEYAALCAAWRLDVALPVYSGACERTIYAAPEVNHAFRAWHDATHVRLGADFSIAGEIRTAREQLRQAAALGADWRTLALLHADTIGQVLYFARFGRFVHDQRAFARAYIRSMTA
jgi:hypothetical protein